LKKSNAFCGHTSLKRLIFPVILCTGATLYITLTESISSEIIFIKVFVKTKLSVSDCIWNNFCRDHRQQLACILICTHTLYKTAYFINGIRDTLWLLMQFCANAYFTRHEQSNHLCYGWKANTPWHHTILLDERWLQLMKLLTLSAVCHSLAKNNNNTTLAWFFTS